MPTSPLKHFPAARVLAQHGVAKRRTAAGLALAAAPAAGGDPFLRRTVTVQVVEDAGPAVVNITTEQAVARPSPFRPFGGDPFFDRFFHDFFEPRLPQTAQNLGSGVVIDAEGHVLTNEHVVARAEPHPGEPGRRPRVRRDAWWAPIRTTTSPCSRSRPTRSCRGSRLGSSEDLMVGEPVIAIGNPFGLSHTVTTGVISALNRSIRSEERVYHGFLQTDASINPGNSGGPLLNAEGELIGDQHRGLRQARPGHRLRDPDRRGGAAWSRELIEHGEVTPVWLGLDFQDLTPQLREAMELPPSLRGALVNRVREQSPARRAGVQRGDVVVRLDGRPVQIGARLLRDPRDATPARS